MSQQRSRRATDDAVVVENARIVTPDAVVEGGVRIEGNRIVCVGDPDSDAERTVDAAGRLLLPGLIDLHGDDVESHLHPRSGARMDTEMALVAADRANVAAGITTKFHAISFERDPGENRSPELAREVVATVEDVPGLVADHRVHARCEVTQSECVDAVAEVAATGEVGLVSVMSHVPGTGQFQDEDAFREYYEDSHKHSAEEAQAIVEQRSGTDVATIRERVDRVVGAAAEGGVPTASHDDEDPEEVRRLHEVGVDVSEYPITIETAREAHDLGMTVTMGAPNLVRGESQWGNLRTADAIDAGVVDALVADYYPMSLLAAPFVDTGEPLPERVARVTKNPADAVGLTDRGRIAEGARADLLVVEEDPTPTVERAFVAGDPAYRAEGSR